MNTIERLRDSLHRLGFEVRAAGIGRLAEAVDEIREQRRHGMIDAELYDERFARFELPPSLPFPARSILLVAVPATQVVVRFPDPIGSLLLPPTYSLYQTLPERTAEMIRELCRPMAVHVAAAIGIPMKLLAVRSGLGEYGRNNLCYVPQMGSYAHLLAFFSDIEPGEEIWREAKLMDRCLRCRACIRGCPAGAIEEDRLLIHAERCITFHTEKPPHIPLPSPRRTPRTPCAIGCVDCQSLCPVNREARPLSETIEFSSDETLAFLSSSDAKSLPPTLRAKLTQLEWIDSLGEMRRNVSRFIHA